MNTGPRTQYMAPQVRRPAPATASGSVSFSIKQLIGVIGGLALLFGVFAPAFNIPFIGGISLWNISSMMSKAPAGAMSATGFAAAAGLLFFLKTAGYILIGASIATIIVSAVRAYPWLWATGLGSLVFMGYGLISFISTAVQASAKMKEAMGDMPSGIETTSMPSFNPLSLIGFGSILIIVGIIVTIVAAFLPAPEE